MKGNFGVGAFAAIALGIGSGQAMAADSLLDFLKESTFSGKLRADDFYRDYSHDTQGAQPSQSAFSVGGLFDVETAPFLGGFSIAGSFFTANSLGANDRNNGLIHVDQTLAGGGTSLNALGQAYLQYKNSWMLARAGDEVINTPWLPDSDSRMLPASYQGFYADFTPVQNLHLYGLRIFRWKSRTSNDYFQDNLYYAPTFDGDNMRGGVPGTTATVTRADTKGTLALGTAYVDHGLKLALWYYNFEQFASMVYNDTVYTLKTGAGFDPFVGDQYLREWKGESMLDGLAVNTFKGNSVDNVTRGLKGGLNSPFGQLMLSYTAISDHVGTVGNGALISPYTVGYTTDPLDTSSMIRGEVDQGPGHAWRVRYTDKFLGDKVVLIAALARYYSEAFGSSNNSLLDVAYSPGGVLKGFSIRNRIEDAVAAKPSAGLNPGKSKIFVYERFQLQYEF